MESKRIVFLLVGGMILASPGFAGEGSWVQFVDETSTRMPTPLSDPSISTLDQQEKDYAWGDLDQDGDIDLVVARKQPFTTPGRFRNVFFMNEGKAEGHAINGVLVDRSAEFVPGFLDETADRDIAVVDVNGDEWLDVVTATTYGDDLPVEISHPRVYINQGEIGGVWQGLEFDMDRMPVFSVTPDFCGVAAGDVTGDGSPDLYFIDYGVLNDRLLINDGGTGHFLDESAERVPTSFLVSAFGIHAVIADLNGDGLNDITKNEDGPVEVAYNTGGGFFEGASSVYFAAAYFHNLGDLNHDGSLDIIISDDGTDRYLLNQGNDGSGHATFLNLAFPSAPSTGFGGNSLIVDLNNDLNNDIVITDVDVDVPGCTRSMHLYHNNGVLPNPSMLHSEAVIPEALVTGTHDAAVFDLNNDGWLDIVVGRCSGTQVWMNFPPSGIQFTYPEGLPAFVSPGQSHSFQVHFAPTGDEEPAPGSGTMQYSINDGPFTEVGLDSLGNDLYLATLPALQCADKVDFYLSGELVGGSFFTDPPTAPGSTYTAYGAEGTEITFRDEMEEDVSGWTVESDPSLTSGAWVAVEPVPTLWQEGFAAPLTDATQGDEAVIAFVTQNGIAGGAAAASDVDGGATYLTSPAFDLEGTDATISFARWFFSVAGSMIDAFTAEVSNDDGQSWVTVHEYTPEGVDVAWETVSFIVGDFVEPSDRIRVRFSTEDLDGSITEAGVDNFQIDELVCGECSGDLDGSGEVGFADLLQVLAAWGDCESATCPQDLDSSGGVGFADLLIVLSTWGPCG